MSESVSIQDVYDELKFIRNNMISKEEFNSALETIEILHHDKTMKRIAESDADIKAGRTKAICSVNDLLADL